MIIHLSGTRKRNADLMFRVGTRLRLFFSKSKKNPLDFPVIINNFNRLDCLKQLIAWLQRAGMTNIHIIDNNSTYPPLLSFYKTCPFTVYKLNRNVGFLALWKTPVFKRFSKDYYIYTDPDIIPVEACPLDTVQYFFQILHEHPEYDKVGFGLKTDDIPDYYPLKHKVISWEKQFIEKPVSEHLFDAPIDTTFALYRPGVMGGSELKAIRTGGAYMARHTSWYIDPLHLSDEDLFYVQSADRSASWTANLLGKETNLRY